MADQMHAGWKGAGSGLFLYVIDERPVLGGITVLAAVPNADAAFFFFDSVMTELRQAFSSSSRSKPRRRSHKSADTSVAYP